MFRLIEPGRAAVFHPEEEMATIRQGGCCLAHALAQPRQACVEVTTLSGRKVTRIVCWSAPTNPGNWKEGQPFGAVLL